MEEKWKLITCLKYQNQMTAWYEASNLGNIRNARTKRLIKPHIHNTGYRSFQYRYHKIEDDKDHFTCMLWHRVIALTWIENPDNLPQIDHINHDVTDNRIENLRWVSAKENAANTRAKSKIRYSRNAPTRIIDREGNIVGEYPTLLEACKVHNTSLAHAFEMLHGRRLPRRWGTFQQDVPNKDK